MEPEGRFREIARGSPTAQWLQSLSSYCPERPKAVLVISAHWEEQEEFAVTGSDTPGLLFDYFNFPAHTYQLKYPSPGAPDTAQQVKRLVEEATGRRVGVDTRRGLDHGVFVPLLLGCAPTTPLLHAQAPRVLPAPLTPPGPSAPQVPRSRRPRAPTLLVRTG